jgi:hypothetical protein
MFCFVMQAHYEATAEMTDVSPCASLTVRLLSLQSKTSVHIEEIYIFVDPAESTNDDSVTGPGNLGGSSLLAMLVPGLMQMSKSKSCKIDDGYFSHGSRNHPAQDHAVKDSCPYEKIAQEAGPYVSDDSNCKQAGIERGIDSADGRTVSNEKRSQDQLQYKDPVSIQLPVQTTENMQMPPVKDQLVSDTNRLANPLMNGTFTPYNHIERKLDTLLSKVEKMELYCSRFEDSMIKPLGSIDARLERLEQQFDSFSVEIQSLRDSSRMSQEKVDNGGNATTPASVTDRKPSLFVRVSEFSSESSCNYNVADGKQANLCGPNVVPKLLVKVPEFIPQPELTGEKLQEGAISPVDCAQSSELKERKTSPGLVIKVPEFPDDDEDDEVEEEKKTEVSNHDDHTQDDTLCRNTIDSSKSKNRVSVNGALASALEALLMSTKGTSSSKSLVCPVSSVSVENTNESSSCSVSPGNVEMSTKDGCVDQIPGSTGNANFHGTFISCQEIDGSFHTSLPKPVLEDKIDTNEKNNHLDSDKLFIASTVSSMGVPSQHHIVFKSVDGSCVNEQNKGPKFDTKQFITSTEPLHPSQPAAACESVENGAKVAENRPAGPLAEFLATRNSCSYKGKNGTSEVCCSTNGAEILSFDRTLAGSIKNSTNLSQLVVKKALEVDGEGESTFSVPVGATFEGSSCAAPYNVVKEHNNRIETVIDKDCVLENTENSARFSLGLNSLYSQCSAMGSQKKMTENNSFDLSLEGSFSEPNAEDSLSDLSSMESFGGVCGRQPVFSGSTAAGKCVDDLFAGTGTSSTITSIAGGELQKVCDLLYDYQDDMLGMTSTGKTSNSSPSLEVLLAKSSDSEAQTSDLEDIDSVAGIGSAQMFGLFSSSDDSASAPTEPLIDAVDLLSQQMVCAATFNEPLVDVVDLAESEAYAASLDEPLVDVVDLPTSSETASGVNEPLVDVVDQPTSSETASDVNEPLVDVVDQPTSSETASGANEPLANFTDLPKSLETYAGGSSGEHPNGLI